MGLGRERSGYGAGVTARLLTALAAVVVAGTFAPIGGATDLAIDEPIASGEATGDPASDGTGEIPPADSSEPAPSDVVEPPPVESPPPTDVVEPPPVESPPPTDVVEPPPVESPPPTDVVEPPPAESPPTDVVEPPPVVSPPELPPPPLPPLSEEESKTSPARQGDGLAIDFSGFAPDVPVLFDTEGSPTALFVGEAGQAPSSGVAQSRGEPTERPSKADDWRFGVSAPQSSPASSSSSAAGAAPPSAGAGFGIAAEFIVPLLMMLSCAFALALMLPHGSAYALRSERPG